ncbi:MAG TPA: MerR family transcriptional regulator [Streptosporangiaceae bacterium]
MTGSFSPSQAAEQSGFSLDTLRYYERIGLLDAIERTPSGHRRFDSADLDWLGILRCLRDTGMPIAQMRRYAELSRGGQATMDARLQLLTEHDQRVQERMARLRTQQRQLQEKIHWYRTAMAHPGGPDSDCLAAAGT